MFTLPLTTAVSASENVEIELDENGYVTYSEDEGPNEEIKNVLKEKEEEGHVTYSLEAKNESVLELTVNNADIVLNPDQSVEIQGNKTGEKVTLPSNSVDKNGNEVKIQYELMNDNTIEIQVVDKNVVQLFSWKDALQCGLGIAGGGGTAGLAGFGGFGIPGAIVGGVAGGMTGAAASCF